MNKITLIKSVSEFNQAVAEGVVCLIDLSPNGSLRHSYVTKFMGFIEADASDKELCSYKLLSKQESNYEIVVYDLLDRTCYKLRPHEVDAKAYRIAGFTPPEKAGDRPFQAGVNYSTLPGLTFQGEAVPAECTAHCLVVSDEFAEFSLSLPNGKTPVLRTNTQGVLIKGEKSLPVVSPACSAEGYTEETNSYLVFSEAHGPLHLPAGFRNKIDMGGTGRIEPTVEYSNENGLIDVVLLSNKVSV